MADQAAEDFIDMGAYQEAIDRLEFLLESSRDEALRMRLATCYFNLGKMGDALLHARQVVDGDSSHREDALYLSAYCLRNLRRFRESSTVYQEYAVEYPNSERSGLARFSAGLCLEELDDWMGAAQIYEDLGGDEAEFRRALCFERNGQPDQATHIMEGFIEKYPTESPEMIKVRFRLGAMRLRQGRTDEAVRHLEEAKRLGAGTFIGDVAGRLLDRAQARKADVTRKLKGYSS